MEEELLLCETAAFVREIKSEGIYLMLSKNREDILFYSDNSPRDEMIKKIQDNAHALVSFLKSKSYLDS